MVERPLPDGPAAEMGGNHLQIRHFPKKVGQTLGRRKIITVIPHMKQHGKSSSGHGAVHLDSARGINGNLLKIRMNLKPPKSQLLHSVQLLLIILHPRVERAKADKAGMLTGSLCQKGIDIVDLLWRSSRIADHTTANAGLRKLLCQTVRACNGISGFVVEFSDGMSRFFRQLIGKYMYMDICYLHKITLLLFIVNHVKKRSGYSSSIRILSPSLSSC